MASWQLAEQQLAWSPQTGLWVLAASLNLHSGVFTCRLRLGDREQQQLVRGTVPHCHQAGST